MKTRLALKAKASFPALLAVSSLRVQWTDTDQKKAFRQGWGIFDDDTRGQEIQRLDQSDRFESDGAAEAYVCQFWRKGAKAARRNPTAFKALEYLAERGKPVTPLVTVHDPRYAAMPHLANLP